ncbi:hypothetical protein B0H10DRAFT_2195833 [Mycena sp. CBHHK59/15]|nr:hypothetical protein B0H10DRAFT_2195833 [Mycena sp. CBHHK59/15]
MREVPLGLVLVREPTPPPPTVQGGQDAENKGSGARRRNPHGIAPSDVDEAAKPTQRALQRHIRMAAGLLTADAVLEPADTYIDHYDKRFNKANDMEDLMRQIVAESKKPNKDAQKRAERLIRDAKVIAQGGDEPRHFGQIAKDISLMPAEHIAFFFATFAQWISSVHVLAEILVNENGSSIIYIELASQGDDALQFLVHLSVGEAKASAHRESALLAYAANLDKQALKRGHLARWANDLQDLADAIPDTHGLMIHRIWKGLPPPIRRQISPNHASWETFCNALRNLVPGVETIPDTIPLPWHREPLPPYIPYQIGDTPSRSGLVVKLNRHMPELFRGRDPDPSTPKKKKKNRSLSPGPVHDYDYVSDSEDEDIDTAVIPEPEPEAEPKLEISVPLSSEMHGDGTDLSRYFWPRYALPVLSNGCQSAADALTSAGMRLVGLVYDARKTIMDLGSIFVEFEPLLHTSPQIYTRKQWDGVKQVPRTVASSNIQLFPFTDNNHFKYRGFKIGYAIKFLSHILSWNTFDNNFRLHWHTRDDFVENYEDSHVPDPIYDYLAWCSYCVECSMK